MGDLQWVRGEVKVTPPLNWTQIKQIQESVKLDWEIKLDIEEVEKDTPDGPLLVRTCSAIVPHTEERYKGYYVRDRLQEVVKLNPKHTFSGSFTCWPEQPEQAPRQVWVDGAKVHEADATITWPADSGKKGK